MKEIRVGISFAPHLADHGFQDLTVLPGSFYVETALSLEQDGTSLIRNVTFQNPIILSAEDTVIKIQITDRADNRIEYAFYEANSQQCAARLEIERNALVDAASYEFSMEAFQAQSEAMIDAETLYRRLRENGNQYGPHFQQVAGISRRGDQMLGKVRVGKEMNACSLDAVTQLLAPFIMEQGKTFILKSIAKIEVRSRNFPDTLWGHATMYDSLVGDVRVFDESGNLYIALSGVTFSLLDRAEEKSGLNLVIAANFIAEPLEDSLKFWGDHFSMPVNIEFAPYNQVFQQLLDTSSAFRRNTNGFNIILLNLDDWTGRASVPASLAVDKQKFAGRPTYFLPNGLEIVQLNQYETDYVYKEIFEDQAYLRHGIQLNDGDTVVDIGANIGLFSVFVMSRCKNPRIYAYEPAPMVYELLKANCEAHGANAKAFNCGVSDTAKVATFTFYEKSSVFSGFHSDENEDRSAIHTVVRNILNGEANEYIEELTADRLRHRTHECQLISVSDIIRENKIERIDLLKIDAEKSELDILKGIDEGDWPKIDQIVMEIHDRTGEMVERIQELLNEKGFHCAVEEEKLLEHSGLFNLYARRGDARQEDHCNLARNVQDFSAALRAFMAQSTVPLIICLTPNKAGPDDPGQALLSKAGVVPNVHIISSASLLKQYPVKECHDPDTDHAGHIPYTPEAYAAIGTALMRKTFNLKSSTFKVIALDCDNTLWKGVCGEDGPQGIEPFRVLQEFMVDRMKVGMLLCLCSKNNEADALAVFEQRCDMPLKREHLAACRLNWNRKSENIKALGRELNLGLDAFIFIDDNPVDCADVKINCPEVLTLQLPTDPALFPSFLNHIWPFDRTGSTEEDQNRTQLYQENWQRQKFRDQTLSLKDFIKGLQLQIEITEATEDQLGRVSQLTFRTNQFNFTTIRRSENELRAFLKRKGAKCVVVRVADRFGDYGLVGALLYDSHGDRYQVNTFLLSCRVLGRGVEHAALAWLGQQALREGKGFVELTYVPTDKNAPALDFLKSLGENGTSWTFSANRLAGLQYDPDRSTEAHPNAKTPKPSARRAAWSLDGVQQIGESLYNISLISKAIEEYRLKKEPALASAELAGGNALEIALLNIWRKVLGRSSIGLNDNFFEAGGTSLRAVQVIAAIKKELKQTLSIVSLFECPTVSLLAATMSGATPVETSTASAATRGQRRRYNIGGPTPPRATT